MSDEFSTVARKEILVEMTGLKNTVSRSNNDAGVFQNAEELRSHFHKIAGLAPMIGHQKLGETAKVCDQLLNHVMKSGMLSGLHNFIAETIEDMTRIFQGRGEYDLSGFKKAVRQKFPDVPIR